MEDIIEELEMEAQNKFFTEVFFRKQTSLTIGGFFELVSINAIKNKKLNLPGGDIQYELRVAWKCDMCEIKARINEYIKKEFEDNQKENIKKKWWNYANRK